MVDRINKDVVAIIRRPDVKRKLGATLMEPVGSSPEDFRALIDREVVRWAPVIKAANVKVN
jgi:tripartite-type tricarboxylate transporter receptor subunit TctC